MPKAPVVDVIKRVAILIADVVSACFNNAQDAQVNEARHGVGECDPLIPAGSETGDARGICGNGLDPVR